MKLSEWISLQITKKSISSAGNNRTRQDLQQRTAVLSAFWNAACTLCWLLNRSHGWLCLTVTSLLSSVPSFIALLQHQQSNGTLFIWPFLTVCFIKTKKAQPVCDFPADVRRGDKRQRGTYARGDYAAGPPPVSSPEWSHLETRLTQKPK